MVVWEEICDWVADKGHKKVHFAGEGMSSRRGRGGTIFQVCETKMLYTSSVFCLKIPHSCCEFTAQLTAGKEPHFLFFCHSKTTLTSQRTQNTLRWPVSNHKLKWKGDQWGESESRIMDVGEAWTGICLTDVQCLSISDTCKGDLQLRPQHKLSSLELYNGEVPLIMVFYGLGEWGFP